ncbi:unnamed protein product [Candida verbasci]|uniref:Uncharacterized protein n=1 Tax=Candida verbasci TaxID=1227364 RepID=A0A9W4TY18_9ASCO|nr:unnamed protein product [Candida verbasci]
MKFAKTLERTLAEDIPSEWVETAIQYKALKKTINKVVTELEFLGLEQDTLKLLINEHLNSDISDSPPIIAEYKLTKTEQDNHIIKPVLKITLDYSNKNYSDDHIYKIGIELKRKIELLLNDEDSNSDDDKIIELKDDGGELKVVQSRENSLSPPTSPTLKPEENNLDGLVSNSLDSQHEVYIILNSDAKFFDMLNDELNDLDLLREQEEDKIIEKVQDIAQLIRNAKRKQTELYKWRQLFKIYLDSEVYFKYNEIFPSSQRNSEQIKKNLDEFLSNVDKSGVMTQLKKKNSLTTFNQFTEMNFHLLKILQFQTINNEALRKILKKFDKQTSLNIKNTFPKLVTNDHVFMSGSSVAQSICFIIQESIIQLIPQIDDYSCPICTNIAYKPIRLNCGHLFCVRCLVKLKQQDKTNCPMCRKPDAVANADSRNLDLDTMELMKRYFPIEVKAKLKERDKEKFTELKQNAKGKHGEKCIVM